MLLQLQNFILFYGKDGKESAQNVGDLDLIPGFRKIPWRREWLPTSVFLSGEFHGQRSLVGYSLKVKSLSHAWLFATPWTVACTKLLSPWDFPGKSPGVGCHFLLQGIFPIQGSDPGLPHCTQTLYHLSYQGSPRLPSRGSQRVGYSLVTNTFTSLGGRSKNICYESCQGIYSLCFLPGVLWFLVLHLSPQPFLS